MSLREPFNGISHLTGAGLAAGGTAVLVTFAAMHGPAKAVTACAVYGGSMVLLYLASALYHLVPAGERRLAVLRRLDHVAIAPFIAGSYTPLTLIALPPVLGWVLFGVVWGLTLGILTIELAWFRAPRYLKTALYVAMGWLVVFFLPRLVPAIGPGGSFWLALGGACYTIGAVIYALKRPDPWPKAVGFHGVWHCCVLAGTITQYWAVLRYVVLG